MSEYDKKMEGLRKSLPQAYDLKGSAGTGKLKAPKRMDRKQEAKWHEAVQRRMNPDFAAKMDEMKRKAQEEYRKKQGKKRPTYFPPDTQEEEFEYFEDKDAPTLAELAEKQRDKDFEYFEDEGAKTLSELYKEELDRQDAEYEEEEARVEGGWSFDDYIEEIRREKLREKNDADDQLYDYGTLDTFADPHRTFIMPEVHEKLKKREKLQVKPRQVHGIKINPKTKLSGVTQTLTTPDLVEGDDS